ncbi:MAG: hypothetical protein AAGI38_24850 [Bacteroidota bacterium]
MKRSIHVIYVVIIFTLLAILYVGPTQTTHQSPSEYHPGGKKSTIEKEKQLMDPFGIEYGTLDPLEVSKDSPDMLSNFMAEVEESINRKSWDHFISYCSNYHYDEQKSIGFNDEEYILQILGLHNTEGGSFYSNNEIKSPNDSLYSRLSQIKRCWFFGTKLNPTFGLIPEVFGYLELSNGLIRKISVVVRETENGLAITGAVG